MYAEFKNTKSTLESLNTDKDRKYVKLQMLITEGDYLSIYSNTLKGERRIEVHDAALRLIQDAIDNKGDPVQTSLFIGGRLDKALQNSRPHQPSLPPPTLRSFIASCHRKGILASLTYEVANLRLLHFRCERLHVAPFDRLPLRILNKLAEVRTPRTALDEVASRLSDGEKLKFDQIAEIIARHRAATGNPTRQRKTKADKPKAQASAAKLATLAKCLPSLDSIATTEADQAALARVKAMIEQEFRR